MDVTSNISCSSPARFDIKINSETSPVGSTSAHSISKQLSTDISMASIRKLTDSNIEITRNIQPSVATSKELLKDPCMFENETMALTENILMEPSFSIENSQPSGSSSNYVEKSSHEDLLTKVTKQAVENSFKFDSPTNSVSMEMTKNMTRLDTNSGFNTSIMDQSCSVEKSSNDISKNHAKESSQVDFSTKATMDIEASMEITKDITRFDSNSGFNRIVVDPICSVKNSSNDISKNYAKESSQVDFSTKSTIDIETSMEITKTINRLDSISCINRNVVDPPCLVENSSNDISKIDFKKSPQVDFSTKETVDIEASMEITKNITRLNTNSGFNDNVLDPVENSSKPDCSVNYDTETSIDITKNIDVNQKLIENADNAGSRIQNSISSNLIATNTKNANVMVEQILDFGSTTENKQVREAAEDVSNFALTTNTDVDEELNEQVNKYSKPVPESKNENGRLMDDSMSKSEGEIIFLF